MGDIVAYDASTGLADIHARNKFGVGDRVQIIHPSGNQDLTVESLLDKHGNVVQEASGSGYCVKMPVHMQKPLNNAMLARYLD